MCNKVVIPSQKTYCYRNTVGFPFVFTFVIISLIKEEMLDKSLLITATVRVVVISFIFYETQPFASDGDEDWVFCFLFLDLIKYFDNLYRE
ncbi:hypothetical protein BTW32_30280 [Bacillus thuringiensis]|nr:hypothetical protein BTW32_30280 [Bacillus thuringiensis]